MKEISNFADVPENQGGEYERPIGGFICKITAVEDKQDKEYLQIEFDVAAGKFKGYFADTYQRAGFWAGKLIRSYKDTAAGFFKGFTSAVEQSNTGYKWAWDERTLVNKLVGLVLAEEEYMNNAGEIKTRLYVAQTRSVDAIKTGDFKVPTLKKFKGDTAAVATTRFEDVPDTGEVPF